MIDEVGSVRLIRLPDPFTRLLANWCFREKPN